MPSNPKVERETRRWLEIVRKDLRRARKDLDSPPPDAESAMFHCQQAVEKAMKAFLVCHNVPFTKTHDLANLGNQCIGLDQSLRPLVLQVASLTDYAVEYRYPSELAEPTIEQAEQAIALASEFVTAITNRLPEEARVKPESP
jgi:HEPN domain-containing protein